MKSVWNSSTVAAPRETAISDPASRAAYRGGMRPLAALVCSLVLLLTACGTDPDAGATTATDAGASTSTEEGGSAVPPAEPDGADAPAVLDFASETVNGEPFEGAALAGKPTVFWFWAPWCPTCRAQISGVGELAATYGSEVNVVGVGSLDEPAAIEEFAAEVSSDVTLLTDPDGAVWRHFGVTAQSTYLVLDENGTEQASGYLDDAELVDLVDGMVG